MPSYQLELVVAAFSLCAGATYGLFWNKPKDVHSAREIPDLRYPTADETMKIALEGPTTFFHYRDGYRIPNNSVQRLRTGENPDDYPRNVFILGSIAGALVFGVPHLLAWNF